MITPSPETRGVVPLAEKVATNRFSAADDPVAER
jgi:hypothetical protein